MSGSLFPAAPGGGEAPSAPEAPLIYLDYAANTPVDPAVLEVFCRTELRCPGNPNAGHPAGWAAREELERVTGRIAGLLGVSQAGVLYTSGASESNNLAVKGIALAPRSAGRHIITTPLEHPSVTGPLAFLERQGYAVDRVALARDGAVDLEDLRRLLRRDTVLTAVCAVDSELGTVQPIRRIGAILRDFPNCQLHVDATQAVGKTALELEGADTVSIAPHKFYGLNGSGLLLKRPGLTLEPQIHGGGGGDRGGTPALALAASAEAALRLALTHQEERLSHVRALNHRLRAALARYPGVRINSPAGAVPHILNLSVRGVMGTVFQRALARQGVCVSVKSACSPAGGPSQAVYALTGDRRNALSSWRISLSHLTTPAEAEAFLEIFHRCLRELAP